MRFLTTHEQTLVTYENIRIQIRRKNIWTPHVIRSPMVPSFCRLKLPQPSYRPIKTIQVLLWNTFFALSFIMALCIVLKVSTCTIMLGFRKSGHICVISWHLTELQHYYSSMNAFKLVFSTKACFKVVVRSMNNPEAIVFLVDPNYKVLWYLITLAT